MALAMAACAASGEERAAAPPAPRLPWPALAMPAVADPADNPSSPEKIELGRLLFHDPLLSSDRKVACATCHSPYWGMADGLSFSVGVGGVGPVGTGRTGATRTRRNARTLWNAAYREALFWDGRAGSLEEQVLAPLADPIELGRVPDEVVGDLRAIPEYERLFRAAFPGDAEPVRVATLQRAIAAFVRTIVTTNAPYDQYVRGDPNALAANEVRGMFLFGEVGCAKCHVPPLFESEQYADAGLAAADEPGRFAVTRAAQDWRAMRVPTLRNVRDTAPYFHDGSAATLEGSVDVMARAFAPRPLTDDEREAITLFLRKGLEDLRHEPERPLDVPSGLPVPVDGFRIPR